MMRSRARFWALVTFGDASMRRPFFGGRASSEDILAVEHDVIPLDWTDAFQQGEIDSICGRLVPLTGAIRDD
jgi:hypothetical protein